MNLGAEPKKIAMLGGLVAVGAVVFYVNVLSGPDTETRTTPARPPSVANTPAPNIARAKTAVRATREFRPTLKFRPEDKPNYATIDPTLKLDLLAKVQSVEVQGGSRSLFQFAAAPAV